MLRAGYDIGGAMVITWSLSRANSEVGRCLRGGLCEGDKCHGSWGGDKHGESIPSSGQRMRQLNRNLLGRRRNQSKDKGTKARRSSINQSCRYSGLMTWKLGNQDWTKRKFQETIARCADDTSRRWWADGEIGWDDACDSRLKHNREKRCDSGGNSWYYIVEQ